MVKAAALPAAVASIVWIVDLLASKFLLEYAEGDGIVGGHRAGQVVVDQHYLDGFT